MTSNLFGHFWPPYLRKLIGCHRSVVILDILWGEPINLAQVASTSELSENLTSSKIEYEKFGQKFLIPHRKWIFWCPNISRNLIFEHLEYNFETSWPKKLVSNSSFMDVYLVICTCTYIKSIWPSLFDKYKTGAMGSFWKCARIGERLSPYVAFGCLAMAFQILFITWISKMKINYLQSHQRLQKCVF